MMKLLHSVGIVVIIGCLSGVPMVMAQAETDTHSESRADKRALIVEEEYIIGPQDVLEISVWRNPDLSREVFVRPDGKISLPLIGEVVAVGRTPTELQEEITERLKKYKENPTVAVIVKGVNSYFFYVQGEIGGGGGNKGGGGAAAGSGKFPLLTKTNLVQAITLAGGLGPDAARNRIVIFRLGRDGAKPQRIVVDYDAIVFGEAENIELKPGDTIVIPSQARVRVP
ncbi:MAG: hypothetical protein D6690_01750 [Nitrospirae bacterium]|nr:MAG: hypothetical protein D6690_01750 [Nitrospirota bacterium]